MLIETAIAQFITALRQSGRASPATISAYGRDLLAWSRFSQQRGQTEIAQIDRSSLRAYLVAERSRGVAIRSLRRHFAALRALYRHLQHDAPELRNPVQGLAMPRAEQRLPDWLTVDQAHLLMHPAATPETAAPQNFTSVRDQLILELLYSSALRVSELAGLNLGDLDRHGGTVRVLGKGRKARIVPAGQPAWVALRAYLALRPASEETALFVNPRGRRLSVRSIQMRVKKLGEARLRQPLHPHTLRHSAASHLLQSSGDLRAVQEYLGHADIGTTAIYTHMDYQQLARVYDQAHPRARRGDQDTKHFEGKV
ncbi:tyrosine recombinase XerC [Acidithiobacillus sp.]|jgi:integrase/recombinase XerC|uniref:tyrosine recombinase XerC n=1 Tax=Acidithiobacillus sp. TaxID=1872118 RepID=UPI0025C522B7|nr:tyrosine recombinase XerC [Acidithiobacillus sp.]MCK9189026.1 tyrosine recombinase XerC [Acidithiobacillus sp.]MCK9359313.1 tyrosine recombinase XerC [Acidithiobacillus sp.]